MRPADHSKKRPESSADLGWVLDLCDRGIAGCRRRDPVEVGDVLMALTGTLNFEYKKAALGLASLYARCLLKVKRRQFGLPLRVLVELRAACLAALTGRRRGRQ